MLINNNDQYKRQSMRNRQEYRDYLQNQDFEAIPNNRKLRINSEPQYISLRNPSKSRQSTNMRLMSSMTPKQQHSRTSFVHEVSSNNESQKSHALHQQSYIHISPARRSRLNNIQIPYDTEQLNKNVSKVLNSIQQIQTQYRKVSNQNSQAMKQSYAVNPFDNISRHEENSSSFIEELMTKIKKPINYDQKNVEYIQKEKTQLVKLIKNLNKRLNAKLKECQEQKDRTVRRNQGRRRIKTEFDDSNADESKGNSRASSVLEFQRALVQTVEEINGNNKLIDNMKNELEFLTKKFQNYQHSVKNYRAIENSIVQMKQLIKKKKQQISRVRKNKFLNQKAIMSIQKRNGNVFASNSKDILSTDCSTSTHSGDILASLKDQFSELIKKKEKLKDKIELTKMHLNRIQELKEKNHVNKEHFDQLAQQMKRLSEHHENASQLDSKLKPKSISLSKPHKPNELNTKTPQSAQHIDFIYKTKKSRLQMLMNTIKRTQQGLKRKYLNLLKQYQAMVDQPQEQRMQYRSPSPSKSKSPTKAPIIKIYKQHEKMIDDKLDKSKDEIEELQKRVERIGKVGKIAKKINNLNNTTKDNHSEEYNDTQQDYDIQFDQEYYEHQNSNHSTSKFQTVLQRSQNSSQFDITKRSSLEKQSRIRPNLITGNSSFSKDHITNSNGNTVLSSPSQKPHSLHRIYSGDTSFHYHEPSYSHYKNDHYSQSQWNKKFLTEDDRSFTSDLSSVMDKSVIRYNRQQAEDNRNNRKYIGKFKKQRILQRSPITSQSQPLRESIALKYQGENYPIIEQQIEGTSEQQTSGMWNREQGSNHSYSRVGRQGGYPSTLGENYRNSGLENQTIEEQLEREGDAEAEMEMLEREVEKQQREEEMKEKFKKILFKNTLFSS